MMKRNTILSVALTLAVLGQSRSQVAYGAEPADQAVIPVFTLSGTIVEKPPAEQLPFDFGGGTQTPLRSLLERMRKVKEDDQVKAVVLMVGSVSMGYAQMEEFHQVIREIRDSGRKVYAHADELTMGRYALLSAVDELSMVPTGYLFITGIYGEQMFLRGMLDKLGIIPDYMTCGDYKSAGEMFMRKSPSPEAAEMTKWLYDGIYTGVLDLVANGRGVNRKQAEAWIDHGLYTAETAVEAGVIDKVQHRQELEKSLRETYGENAVFERRYGRAKQPEIDLSSPFGVLSFYGELLKPPEVVDPSKSAVAIVHVEGAIMPGSGSASPLGGTSMAYSTDIRRTLDQVADDDSIKAVVLRVNSPGGSAVASEIILDATRRVKARKPLVVSMGDVAGSGGYYVACAAETIFADPSTITGSIGVVSGKFATTGMWNKLGINWNPIARGKNAGLLSFAQVFNESERDAMQTYMDDVYGVFKGHVLAIREDRLKKDIDELAGGRVYTGAQALELGLVDKLGSLEDAIHFAAAEASLDEYAVRTVPRSKNLLELMMSDLTGGGSDPSRLLTGLPGAELNLIEQAAPYLHGLDPVRTRLVIQALTQMQLMARERVVLTMPLMYMGK